MRARKEAGAIRDALLRGDFYASNGVILDDVRVTAQTIEVVAANAKHTRAASTLDATFR